MISLIVAVAQNKVIGKSNTLPWRIKDDMRFFKEKTTGHTVVMGRKNYESIGRPLPNRTNVIITRQKDYLVNGCIVVNSLEKALTISKDVFVIGGADIYRMALPVADVIYRTQVLADVDGDILFPDFDESKWNKEIIINGSQSEDNEYSFTIEKLTRKL